MSLWTAKAHELRTAQARLITELARTTEPETTFKPAHGVTLGGDERRLRGIPAIGRGVAGAINGTKPAPTGPPPQPLIPTITNPIRRYQNRLAP